MSLINKTVCTCDYCGQTFYQHKKKLKENKMNNNPIPEAMGQQLPEITNQMLRLGEKIDHLGDTVEILGKRLTPLLTPSPDAPAENMAVAKSINSPFTDNLRALSYKIESISEEVQEMLNALEI